VGRHRWAAPKAFEALSTGSDRRLTPELQSMEAIGHRQLARSFSFWRKRDELIVLVPVPPPCVQATDRALPLSIWQKLFRHALGSLLRVERQLRFTEKKTLSIFSTTG